MPRTYPSKIDLPEAARTQIIGVLNANLANAIDLALQSKQAHWNVKGPSFIALHELFDQTYAEVTAWVDLLAERAVQLGGIATGTLQSTVEHSVLPAYDTERTSGKDHLDALSKSVATFGKSIRSAIASAEGAGDAGTPDLFTEVSRGADKTLWFLESHLQADQ